VTGVAGDTRVFTGTGIWRMVDLWSAREAPTVLAIGPDSAAAFVAPLAVARAGWCGLVRLQTREGFFLRAGSDQHILSAERGWVPLSQLCAGEPLCLAAGGGAYGGGGDTAAGHVLGWLAASGHLTRDRAVLRFESGQHEDMAPLLAAEVNAVIRPSRGGARAVVGPVEARSGGAVTIASSRLREFALHAGWDDARPGVPTAVWRGTRAAQQGFLQAVFEAWGEVETAGPRAGVHLLAPRRAELLPEVQQLLLNLGLYSRIVPSRATRSAGAAAPGRAPSRGAVTPRVAPLTPAPVGQRLALTGASARRFAGAVGFLGERKRRALESFVHSFLRAPYRERFVAHVSRLGEEAPGWLYGVGLPARPGFVANGFLVATAAATAEWQGERVGERRGG
jgi:ribonucleoside-diphosphate reductase alpha chain